MTHAVASLPRRVLIAFILAAIIALAAVVFYASTRTHLYSQPGIHIADVTPDPSQGGGVGG